MLYLRLKNPLPRDAVSSFYICVENSCEQVYGLEWPKLVDMQVDYFSIQCGRLKRVVFNLGDMFIFFGAGMMLVLEMIRAWKER